jgi:RNA polymerase sigma-70 factor (ECF subfamily)
MRDADRVEFEWVFRSAYASVLRTTYLVLRDRGRAEEVTQDAFVRLYERWRGVFAIEHPEAWVRQVAVRAAIRRAQRERFIPLLREVPETAADDHVPDVDLARALASLPPRQRAAVALFYLEDRPVNEVARLLGVSASTVKQHLFRARASLAAVLGETVDDRASVLERGEVGGDVD